MIARIWHGAVPTHKSNEYLRLMRQVAVPDYRSFPGNHGAFVLRQTNDETTDFIMLTFWDSKDAIAEFAGADIETAKYYKFDRDFLIELEPQVKHYELYKGSACTSE